MDGAWIGSIRGEDFLVKLALALQRYGSPVPRTEAILSALASNLDVDGCVLKTQTYVKKARIDQLSSHLPFSFTGSSTSCPPASSSASRNRRRTCYTARRYVPCLPKKCPAGYVYVLVD